MGSTKPRGDAQSISRFRRDVVTAEPEHTAYDVARKLRDQRVGCVIVVSKTNTPIGIVTDRDLAVRVVAEGKAPKDVTVADIVTYTPLVLQETDGVETAVTTMREHGVRRLPIVDDKGHVVGIVTSDDLMMELGRQLGSLSGGLEMATDSTESR